MPRRRARQHMLVRRRLPANNHSHSTPPHSTPPRSHPKVLARVCSGRWKPSDRLACEELLQDAWMPPWMMQASGRRWTVLKNRQQRDPVAPALVEEVDLTGSAIAASSQGQGSPWWFGAPVACATWRSQCVCRCSGHCYASGHRYRGGCTAVDLLFRSQWCPECACTVSGCGRPRLRSPCAAFTRGNGRIDRWNSC